MAENTELIRRINPWKAIWTAPRRAVRAAYAWNDDNYVHRMMMVFGNALILALNLARWLRFGFHPVEFLLMFFVFGPIAGVVGTYILAAVIRNVGRIFNGIAPKKEMLVAMSWTHLPTIFACLVFSGALAILYYLFPPETVDDIGFHTKVALLIGGVFWLYAIMVRIVAIAEIHVIELWEAIVTFVISILLILAPVIFFFLVYFILFTQSLSSLGTN